MGKDTSGSGNTENKGDSRHKSLSNRYNSANSKRVRPKTHLSVKLPEIDAAHREISENEEPGFGEV